MLSGLSQVRMEQSRRQNIHEKEITSVMTRTSCRSNLSNIGLVRDRQITRSRKLWACHRLAKTKREGKQEQFFERVVSRERLLQAWQPFYQRNDGRINGCSRKLSQAETTAITQTENSFNRPVRLQQRGPDSTSGPLRKPSYPLRQNTCPDLSPVQEKLYGHAENLKRAARLCERDYVTEWVPGMRFMEEETEDDIRREGSAV